ncbi:type I-MYXAN CRISPR-associated protein Cas6/Cmx6 [Polyangium fumosum]|uniref:type I-MYXAN CRISPR-associated protein Cas6/Cmx6 n=1 Tax=Polyangium fumosum TaxID=889272 RepID=UPI001478A3A3|nr:type I-MYXAN CRISPR-associated protein Cas6/Cmx6 [Polyangium fumosum]
MTPSAPSSPPADRVDIVFPLAGTLVPRDHGYALFGALARVLGDLHGASWLAVHPLGGIPRPDGLLALHPRRGSLCLRVVPAEIPRVLALAGKALDVDGYRVHVGVSRVYPLRPAEALTARMVVIKGFQEPEPFAEAVKRQLDALSVAASIEVGRRRIVTIAGDKVVGFGTTLRGLSEEGSLVVQRAGIGGRQRMGCGVFGPVGREARA